MEWLRAHRPVTWPIVPAVKIGDHHLVELQASLAAVHLEDARELLHVGIFDRNLVRNPAQKRFVGERRRVEVRAQTTIERRTESRTSSRCAASDSRARFSSGTIQRLSKSSGRIR